MNFGGSKNVDNVLCTHGTMEFLNLIFIEIIMKLGGLTATAILET